MIITFASVVLAGVILTALTARMRKVSGYIALVCIFVINVLIFNVAFKAFNSPSPVTISKSLISIPAVGASLLVSIDSLSAIFLILIGIISLIATLYSIGYMEIYKKESLVRFYPFLILFIAGMIGVVCVSDLFFFFVFWEFMTLTSYFLVIFEKENPDVLRAGFKYFIMTHIGTAFMFMAGIILQSYTGSFSFTSIEKALGDVASTNPVLLYILLACFFIGFATKAGVYPFGTWLPDAHPAAPSGISAILSGIMIKMGIYGMLRVFLYMLPVTNSMVVWGIIIATFGIVSMVMGTLGALLQSDYKRLFAYSSIGQIGYILLALGIGISFIKDYPLIAAISIIAGLFHLVNHAFFKSLLFLNSGSIVYKTETRDLNETGGLFNIIPFTAITSIIGSMSIIGFPLFSGFVSKWLIYQVSIVGGIKFPLYVLYGVIAIFLSVVTMAYCVKFLCSSFLGSIPSKLKGKMSKEDIPFTMRLSQNILAGFCVVFGLMPLTPLLYIYVSLMNSKLGGFLPPFESMFGEGKNGIFLLINGNGVGIFRPVFIAFIFVICLILSYVIFRAGGAKKRSIDVWNCGEVYPDDLVRYKARSFYLPVLTLLEKWFFPHVTAPVLKRPDMVYAALDFDRILHYPLVNLIFNITRRFRKTHVGIPQVYMLWQAVGIFLVILVLFLFAR
ncbi:MAG: proton-conducting transporter membrane subunit [Planctomycetota bacterium]